MLGYRIFPYCFDMPHLIICAGALLGGGVQERSLLSISTSILTPDFFSDTCGLESGGVCLSGEWAVGLPPCSTYSSRDDSVVRPPRSTTRG